MAMIKDYNYDNYEPLSPVAQLLGIIKNTPKNVRNDILHNLSGCINGAIKTILDAPVIKGSIISITIAGIVYAGYNVYQSNKRKDRALELSFNYKCYNKVYRIKEENHE